MTPRCCVIVCYWSSRSPRALFKLLRQMRQVPAGAAFDVLIVNNGGTERPLAIPSLDGLNVDVLNRRNTGWNLGAWDAGWRHAEGYDYYLFLQSECVIQMPGWVGRYMLRMQMDQRVGLVGERLMWQRMTWEYARTATRLDIEERGMSIPPGLLETIDTYRSLITKHGIDPGTLCEHLVSVVLFSRREVLETVDGIVVIGDSYPEAVASEIATSRRIVNHDFLLAQIADDPFTRIGHPQWLGGNWVSRSIERARHRFDRVLGWR